jgi:hypothetical protein
MLRASLAVNEAEDVPETVFDVPAAESVHWILPPCPAVKLTVTKGAGVGVGVDEPEGALPTSNQLFTMAVPD